MGVFLSRMTTSHFPVFPGLLAAVLLVAIPASGQFNKSIKGLVPLLKPIPASEKSAPGDLNALTKQMTGILTFLGKNHDSFGKDGGDMLELAHSHYGKDLFSSRRRALLLASLTRTWEKAQELGLFTEKGNFHFSITKGVEKGQKASFEYIVLPHEFPQYSTDLTNIRLVTPATRRARDEKRHTTLEKIHAKSLETIQSEILHGMADSLGRTGADNLALWKKDVEADKEALEKAPIFRLDGRITGSPSRSNGDKWKVSFTATNIASHPTEVTVHLYLIGITEEKNELFLLRHTKNQLKLRSNQEWTQELLTEPRKHYAEMATRIDQNKPTGKIKPLVESVNMRGWAIVVQHNDKKVEELASQNIILDYVERAGSLPGKNH